MATNIESAEKRTAVEHLDFGAKTAKRVTWEAWEFTVTSPHLVEVTNASYGFLKDDHSYTVGVEDRGGLVVPAECDCPADVHGDPDCKHKVALATVGGPTVLDAAVNTELRADGGKCPSGDWCPGPNGDGLPCFACFSTPRRGR